MVVDTAAMITDTTSRISMYSAAVCPRLPASHRHHSPSPSISHRPLTRTTRVCVDPRLRPSSAASAVSPRRVTITRRGSAACARTRGGIASLTAAPYTYAASAQEIDAAEFAPARSDPPR